MKLFSLGASLALVCHGAATTQQDTYGAFQALQSFYNTSIGLWIPSTGWWNSANCLTVIADLAKINKTVATQARSIYPNTFVKAQQYNLQMQKVVDSNDLVWTYYGSHWPWFPKGWHRPAFVSTNGFLNKQVISLFVHEDPLTSFSYYDDEGWWALAWIAVYDVTGNWQYLQTAESIFADIAKAYNTTPCSGGGGGVWWDRAETYVNAIANELFLDVAAHLANRAGPRSWYYLNWAKKQWTWFQNSGLINSQHLINDGLTNDTCKNNNRTTWSYNQGIILGALTELSRATQNNSYIVTAKQIADATIANLTDANGILHDPCEPNCGGDGSQFKGVFVRNLQILQRASPEYRYAIFLQNNANSILAKDRMGGYNLSIIWSGPFIQPANASTQSSAMDALVAALATNTTG